MKKTQKRTTSATLTEKATEQRLKLYHDSLNERKCVTLR